MKCPERFQTSSDPLGILIAEEKQEEQGRGGGEAGAWGGGGGFFCFLRIHENHLRELITVVTVSPPRLRDTSAGVRDFPLICCCWRSKKNPKNRKKPHLGWFSNLQVLRLVGDAQLGGCLCDEGKEEKKSGS